MAKAKTKYVCQKCAASFPKWQGQCGECGAWNSLVEETVESSSVSANPRQQSLRKNFNDSDLAKKTVSFSRVKRESGSKKRFLTNIGELDRVLGGGLVSGAVVLLGGEPGIGKSTLLTQMLLQILSTAKKKIFYVCGEESPSQISLRVSRMLSSDSKVAKEQKANIDEGLIFVTSTDVDEICALISKDKPDLVIVDSIQTLSTTFLTGASGSVGQIRESTDRLINRVKAYGIPSFLIGHITKDGTIAGPKVLEHQVDAVLLLEGERSGQLRLLRSLKNRFGATDEVGIFQAVDWGLKEVLNPSELFLENQEKAVSGAATVCVMEGTRPLLAEVQALVVKSQLAMPRRVGRGVDLNRIQVLSAVLQKHAKLPLGSYDVFLSAAGGFKVKEPAVDLGLAVAVASSLSGKKIPQSTIFIGEIGLLGEIRKVPYFERRAKEARRLGFKNIISSKTYKHISQVIKNL